MFSVPRVKSVSRNRSSEFIAAQVPYDLAEGPRHFLWIGLGHACHFHYSKQTVQVRRLPQRKPPPYGDASGVKEALLEIRFCSIYRRSVCREELPECTGNIWQSARGRIMRRTAALPKRNSFLASFISSDRNESWRVLLLANRKR